MFYIRESERSESERERERWTVFAIGYRSEIFVSAVERKRDGGWRQRCKRERNRFINRLIPG